MTKRTQRREAELAVIEAANNWFDDAGWGREARLCEAVRDLRKLEVEAPDAARTGDNNPCLTSSQAAEWMKDKAGALAGRVLDLITSVYVQTGDGLTVEQVENRLSGSHQSISPRFTELRDKGLIKDSNRRRINRSGRHGTVWIPTDLALDNWSPT